MTFDPNPGNADDVRSTNQALDERLLQLANQVDADNLNSRPQSDEWTPAQNLAHLGEFPRFFARELTAILSSADAAVGRTHEHPGRLAAVDDPSDAFPEELRRGLESALKELALVLEDLEDRHLTQTVINRKYGPEPLTAYLDRYVLGHKASHVDQLEKTIRLANATDGI